VPVNICGVVPCAVSAIGTQWLKTLPRRLTDHIQFMALRFVVAGIVRFRSSLTAALGRLVPRVE
jgi:hypothetical protein